MKRLLHLLLRSAISACLMTSAGGGEFANPSDPSGTRIRIEDRGPAGEQRCGYLVWIVAGGTGDANGPKPDKEWARQSPGATQW
jgi:hypothetical protein